MTGTAETEETEFHSIYGLEVSVIPTNKLVTREDRHDLIYKTRREKYNAILQETERLHQLGYPMLIGTVSVDVSETLSRMFQRAGLRHNVLNAKYHQREAEIVAMAGQPGAITIATNMAGRGTDIKLGPGVTEFKPSVVKDPDGNDVDVMDQQREVIYSLRSFALEGGEELKGEAVKMLEKAISRRIETALGEYESAEEWDFPLVQQ